MDAVGYDMYCKLLGEAVSAIKGEPIMQDIQTVVSINQNAFIPKSYIPSENYRIEIYKKISGLENQQDAYDVYEEMRQKYLKKQEEQKAKESEKEKKEEKKEEKKSEKKVADQPKTPEEDEIDIDELEGDNGSTVEDPIVKEVDEEDLDIEEELDKL